NWRTLFSKEFLEMAATGDDRPCGVCRLSWLTSTVHFDKAASHNIRIQYESVYENSSGGPSDDDYYNNDCFRQDHDPGRDVDLKSVTLKPANRFKETPAGLVWEFTNLSPTLADNIEISMNDKFNTVGVYDVENDGTQNSWYSFEGDRYYLDFHGYIAKASSERKGYPVQNIADLIKATAWVADKSGGTDESITLTLAKPAHVDQLGIIPGYTKSKAIHFANNRIKDLEVSVNGGTITLKVKQVYPGSKYNDTCISELLMRTAPQNETERPSCSLDPGCCSPSRPPPASPR
ncbi:MAG TPA: hypothetical protein VKU01_30950, partial [Bryobacteraceae bacterium]|nr:hypothetical protein [Bryobacteraceae bacterium]